MATTIRHDAGSSTRLSAATAPAESATVSQAPDRRGWLRRVLPGASLVVILAGLALWGHFSDWTIPKFSTLVGEKLTPGIAWCEEHNVSESQCIECDKSLVPAIKDFGWCKEHGVSQCPLDHPEVAQLKETPVITQQDKERAERALALRPRQENNSRCKIHERRVQFASLRSMEKVGVDIAVATQHPVIEAIVANGEVTYDETHMAHLASRVSGTVTRVEKQVGDRVQEGDVLALVDSAEVGRAKADLLQAISQRRLKQTTVDRLKPLAEDGSIPGRSFREAEAAFQEAKIRMSSAEQALVNLGLAPPMDEYAALDDDEIGSRIRTLGLPLDMSTAGKPVTSSNLYPLRSPLSGVVVDRKIVSGEVVDTSTTLFAIADISQMWLTLNVRQDEAKYLSLGQTVLFRPSADSTEPEIKGAVAWISTATDDETRTVRVRVNLPNPNGLLRANSFGTGRIVLREEPRAIVVPSEAVHRDGDCDIVFVRDKNFLAAKSPKFFHVRKVRVGVRDDQNTEIIVGLLPGEVIASKNSVFLESQLLKNNLGAGCGCCEGK